MNASASHTRILQPARKRVKTEGGASPVKDAPASNTPPEVRGPAPAEEAAPAGDAAPGGTRNDARGAAQGAAGLGRFHDLRVADLRAELADRDLPTSGRKADLVARLAAALEGEAAGPAPQAFQPAPGAVTIGDVLRDGRRALVKILSMLPLGERCARAPGLLRGDPWGHNPTGLVAARAVCKDWRDIVDLR